MLRSRRLEQLLGAPVGELTAAHLRAAVDARVPEGPDLDWKRDAYSKSDSGKHDLAKDVAALANAAGGLIVLGIEEDEHGCAVAAPGVPIGDAERNRILQVVASLVAPVPDFEVRMIADSDHGERAATGFIVVAVERSAAAPHAVFSKPSLRYPLRAGTTTRYLIEPEVADAYQARLAGRAAVEDRLRQVWDEGIARLDVSNRVYGCVAVVADVAGAMRIDRDSYEAFRQTWIGRDPTFVGGLQTFRVGVGQGRLTADGARDGASLADWIAIDTYTDGAGFFAARASNPAPRTPAGRKQIVEDELLANAVLSGLVQLAVHASSTGASGVALVLAGVHGISEQRPSYLGQTRQGFPQPYNWTTLTHPPRPADGGLPLDLLTPSGRPTVQLASRLCNQIGQAFGVPQMDQFSQEGLIRAPYFTAVQHPIIRQRIEAAGFEISNEP